MFVKALFFKSFFFFLYRLLFRKLKNLGGFQRSVSSNSLALSAPYSKYQKYSSLAHRSDLTGHTLVFDVEGTLLKSSSFFPYFMLVAFEAGGLIRAILLFLAYPFVCLVGEERGLKIMVMVCFFGIKKESFRVGRAVLSKFFLEDVGLEMFEVLKRGGKTVGVSDFPQVMVESFLREYLEIDVVVGRELKVFGGYFLGLMEEKKTRDIVLREEGNSGMIGITRFNKLIAHHELFSYFKEIYVVVKGDKRSWQVLPRESYPKALIFHDGRLAVTPTPPNTLAMMIWTPFGFILAIIRIIIALLLPKNISGILLAFSGLRLTVSPSLIDHSESEAGYSNNHINTKFGQLYVCNHRTLLDPLYLYYALKSKKLTAVTYSLSRMSEILAPIRTVRLTRDRDQDASMMRKLLNEGDLVVCPEGTTCREPYLLRFSPLFSEMNDEITPVAMDTRVGMFYGTTASGLKGLDPLFFLLNPRPIYTIRFLDKVEGSRKHGNEGSRFDVANHVQSEIGKALGFQCTKLTRKDKYLVLAGNEGIVPASKNQHP